ncbi:MAG TPA: hypothetical protein H9881_14395 [Candidatus Stackebrandtia excrementipullorum]|nr:hypothetical protein [Candidatus Stackebrandtia excrementipullorum]
MRSFTGTGSLIRLALRRDRIRIPLWILGVVGFTISFLPSLPDLYPTAAARQGRALLLENPAAVAMSGPGYGRDAYTFGAMIANEFLAYTAILMAIMSVILVVRHTRAEEESGRAELVRAAVVGRHAGVAAAVTVVVLLNLVIGLLLGVLMPATLDSLSATSCLLFGMSLAGVGITFAGVGAVAAQLTFGSRTATGIGMATVGFAYVARAVGDVSAEPVAWLSPIGWAHRTKSFVDDRWWPLAVPVAVAAVLILTALILSTRRDVGSGLMHPRLGRATASPHLTGVIALAWRLQRGSLIAWAVGLSVLGLMYGSVVPEVRSFVASNEVVAEAFAQGGADPVMSFFAVVVSMISMIAGGFVVHSVIRLRGEETTLRADPLLATVVTRMRFIAGPLTVATVGAVVILVAACTATAVSAGVAGGDWSAGGDVIVAGLLHIPALWLVAAVAVTLYGWAPKLMSLAWLIPAYAVVVGMLGVFLNLPDVMLWLSPFDHVPQSLVEDVSAVPLLVMVVATVALTALGVYGFRRRDLA